MLRLIRTLGGMFAVAACYWLYLLSAVPWIEPQVVNVQPKIPADRLAEAENRLPAQVARLAAYFEPGAWELDNPVVVESPDFMLLLRDYGSDVEQQLHIKPCTLVFFPDGDSHSGSPHRRVIIMRAPGGAILDFEEGFSLRRAKMSALLGGRLVGEVTIFGNLSNDPDKRESLELTTRDVQLTSQRIWTPHEVYFRIGSISGGGSDLRIDLHTEPGRDSAAAAPRPTGIESLTLARDVRLSIQTDQAGLLPGENRAAAPADGQPRPPLEVRCRGAFRFEVAAGLATFENQVDVIQPNLEGPSDQLSCEMLAIHFTGESLPEPSLADRAGPAPSGAAQRMRPAKIVAQGSPVVVNSPLRRASARGEHLQYELATGEIQLEGTREVRLTYETHVVEARRLQYIPGARGELGRAVAGGPGRLRAGLPDRPQEILEARWQQELRLRPHEGKQLISLLGGAQVSYGGLGRMSADQLWLWFVEQPADAGSAESEQTFGRARPHSLLARGHVDLDSPRLVGLTEQLEVWFKPVAELRSNGASGPAAGGPASFSGSAADGQSQYHVGGRLIRVQVLSDGRGMQLQDVNIEGNVRLAESVTRPDQPPLRVTGDQLQLLNADSGEATLSLRGQPADLEVRGLGLIGRDIRLHQAENRLWIDGPGSMSLPVDRDLNGESLAQPQRMQVDWQGRMNFDGRRLVVERDVLARANRQSLQTAAIEVQLARPIEFAAPAQQAPVEVARVHCMGGVLMENRTEENRNLVSLDRLHTRSLTLLPPEHRLLAEGPGWLSSVRQGAPAGLAGGSIGGAAAGAGGGGRDQLSYLRVHFAQGIDGNAQTRELVFHDAIRGIYGPVADWNGELPIDESYALRPQDIRLTCDRLIVREIGTPLEGRRPIELECDGNVRVSGQTFEGWARRLTYAAARQMLVFEGTGQEDARLSRQQYPGGPATQFAARKILYWHADQRVQVQDARFLQTGQ